MGGTVFRESRLAKRYAADVLKWVTGLVALALAGCTSPGNGDGATGPEAKPGGGTIVTPAAMRTEGKVVRTNEKLNFVVLDFGFKRLPRAGQQLGIYRLGKKLAKCGCPARRGTRIQWRILSRVRFGSAMRPG